ncbi:multicopper oxidase [Yamadazyma tenuis ATCC 10573]|uniref:Multicopper oxidase n=2 Tax=Candida tenuis TaxID=2315449 RepID=G3B6F4_CANTC|nr:multicopper oxidase [Yamadazyma tenuis ATCC 10573]EGV63682.1 multicopper oxidase [Yamadazyma tenuis ATCC 10573]
MDGPEMVTQCPIPPGFTFTYNFTVDDQVGTFWYHSHSGTQYGDGLRGLFIIEEAEGDLKPFEYDEEVTVTVSEWYHKEGPELMAKFLNRYNPTGAEPIPQNTLFNDTKNVTWDVLPNTTYFVRLVNVGLFTSQYLALEDHTFTIVEVDGVYVEPYEVSSIYISAAQRYGVLVKTKKSTDKNYRFFNAIDKEMLDVLPADLQLLSTNIMRYSTEAKTPEVVDGTEANFDNFVAALEDFDDFNIKPLEKVSLYGDPDVQLVLDFTMDNLGDGVNYAFFNDISYTAPKVPTLYSVMSSGKYSNVVDIYGSNTNAVVLQKDEVVEIVLNNRDPGKHPFHLHGHVFQIIKRSEKGDDDDNPIVYDPSNPEHKQYPEYPLRRDTLLANPNGFIILRFKATNPGVWLFHCHVDWHLEQGLAITLVEAPSEIQKQSVPQNHYDSCAAANISGRGNAAGNYGDTQEAWVDLTGERVQFAPLPPGFTTKGYVAFFLCTVFALYGLHTIYKYGMEDVKVDNNQQMVHKLYRLLDEYGALDENEGISLNSDVQGQASESN